MKTRLEPLLGPHAAAVLYEAFLEDTVEIACGVPDATVELWLEPGAVADPGAPPSPGGPEDAGHGPGGALATLRSRHPRVRIRRQAGEGLGERLRGALGTAFREGSRLALALGTDHPTLPPHHLLRGLELLERVDVVAGPARDGGYYAIGVRREAWPAAGGLFSGIPWSTGRVLRATRRRAAGLDLGWAELPPWYDVDEPRHLRLLAADLRPGSRTAAALTRLGIHGPAAGGAPAPPPGDGPTGRRS